MYCAIASRSSLLPALGGSKALTFGSGVAPSDRVMSPLPPETLRMLSSKSWISSKIAEWFRSLMSFGSRGLNDPLRGSVRRGPLAKIHTTPSVSPNGWHEAQALHPSLESRRGTTPEGPSCGRLTPVELLKIALPSWTVAARVPGGGRPADGTVVITWFDARSITDTSRETSFMT